MQRAAAVSFIPPFRGAPRKRITSDEGINKEYGIERKTNNKLFNFDILPKHVCVCETRKIKKLFIFIIH